MPSLHRKLRKPSKPPRLSPPRHRLHRPNRPNLNLRNRSWLRRQPLPPKRPLYQPLRPRRPLYQLLRPNRPRHRRHRLSRPRRRSRRHSRSHHRHLSTSMLCRKYRKRCQPRRPHRAKVKAEPSAPKGAETKTAETTTPAPHASHAKPAAQSATKTAKVEPAAQPSAEAAKPQPAAQASSSTKPKPSAKPPVTASPEQEAASEPKPGWTPMALAPADKDTVGKPKVAPKRSDAGSYNAKIWSALARHKSRIGKSGSATVTFSIGAGGGLRSIKISGSSGDSAARSDGGRDRARCRALPAAAGPRLGVLYDPHLFPLTPNVPTLRYYD